MENKTTQWRFIREPSEGIDSIGSVTEGGQGYKGAIHVQEVGDHGF